MSAPPFALRRPGCERRAARRSAVGGSRRPRAASAAPALCKRYNGRDSGRREMAKGLWSKATARD